MDYTVLATKEVVDTTIAALKENGVEAVMVQNSAEALEEIVKNTPKGVSIMNGSSKTLEQMGFVEYLKKGEHGWKNLHEAIIAEKDPAKQGVLRKQATLSEFYFGSVHAMTQDGQMVIASNTGSQLPHLVYSSPNVTLVVSTKKIVPTLNDAMDRLQTHVIPLENENMKQKFGIGTTLSKILIFKKESSFMGRKVKVIFVNEDLGF